MHRGLSPSLSHDSVMPMAFSFHSPETFVFSIQAVSSGCSFCRSRNRCLDWRTTGVFLHSLHFGFTNSVAFTSLPHWRTHARTEQRSKDERMHDARSYWSPPKRAAD